MLILALESSAKPASAAVYMHDESGDGGKLLGQYFQNNGFSHSRTLLAMAESLLHNLDVKLSGIDLLAVARGPGSFTGVRIGVSAIKGLAFGLDIPVCGVSTLEAMAYQTMDTTVLICPVMDARRSQVYNALFRWNNGSLMRLREDRAISFKNLAADLKGFSEPVMPVGDGADIMLSELSDDSGLHLAVPGPLVKYQSAHGVALAAIHAKSVSHTGLEPVYLRPSQAERNLTAAGGRLRGGSVSPNAR